jgi:hypothetical protein
MYKFANIQSMRLNIMSGNFSGYNYHASYSLSLPKVFPELNYYIVISSFQTRAVHRPPLPLSRPSSLWATGKRKNVTRKGPSHGGKVNRDAQFP